MKIIVTGLPYFSKRLVDNLNKFDKKNNYYFFNTYYSKKDQLKYLFHLPKSNLVISFNGAYSKSKSLDMAIMLKKPIMMQWHGSDVLLAKEATQNRTILSKYIDYASHFTDATWLQDELKTIKINSKILPFKFVENKETNTSKFKTLDVMSYLAEGDEEFYGINTIINLAKHFPHTSFHIVGTLGINFETPKNVKFYGWINKKKMDELRQIHPIFIRLTQHDGYSLSVMEALANGNEVIWNNPHSQCNFVSNKKDIVPLLKNIQQKLIENNNSLNKSNINWVKDNLQKEKVLTNFVNQINLLAK